MTHHVLVGSSEIALKGKNRHEFEKRLVNNLYSASNYHKVNLIKIKKKRHQLLCLFEDEKELIISMLEKIPGVHHFYFIEEISRDFEKLLHTAENKIKEMKNKGIKSIAFKTNRVDKSFPFKSPQINEKLGEIAKENGIKVDYKGANDTLYISVLPEKITVSSEKYMGVSGLPVGSIGKVLVLLSGGIDSPVASFKLMQKGCKVDYLHFHPFSSNDEAKKHKIPKVAEKLNDFEYSSKLFLLPNYIYETLVSPLVPERYEMVFYKFFMFRLAQRLALKNGYLGIGVGDSIAQVASQTLENMRVTQMGLEIPFLQPLLSYSKDEIIEVARKIETFDLSQESYADCCSLISKSPLTKTNYEKFKEIIEKIDVEGILDKLEEAIGCEKIS